MICAVLAVASAACSDQGTQVAVNRNATTSNVPVSPPVSPAQRTGSQTPAQNITAADIAKLKWLEGSYRGTGAEKPFFNRYRFSGTTLKVQSFEDEAMTKQQAATSYELTDGMFANPSGDERFAATEITDDHIYFVSLKAGSTASYKLEKKADGSVKATTSMIGADGQPAVSSYGLERLNK